MPGLRKQAREKEAIYVCIESGGRQLIFSGREFACILLGQPLRRVTPVGREPIIKKVTATHKMAVTFN